MGKTWSGLSPDEKREERFKRWLSPEDINYINPEAERLYKERITRLINAIKLKEPDRVPVVSSSGTAPARYSGYTVKEVMYDTEKLVKAWTKYMEDFELDVLPNPSVRSGEIWDMLDPKMYRWAGHGLPDDCSPQFVEGEYLKADEWDMFMRNPSDFHLRTYLPRAYGAAKPLNKLPPLQFIGSFGSGFSAFTDPEIQSVFKVFSKVGELEKQWRNVIVKVERKGREMGIPPFYILSRGGAPMDNIGASLRGTIGTVNDMFRQPEKLIEYIEKEIPQSIQSAVDIADMTGIPVIYMPLHRGADGFMSEEQFLRFYWPYLQQVVLGCIEEGLVPVLFAEGSYNSRLEIVKDLPTGKVIWHFDQTDIKKAKNILGQRACIMGNVPTSLLVTGTTDEVKTYCKTLIQTAGKGGGYIMAPGASSDDVKIENLQAMLQSAKEYGVY